MRISQDGFQASAQHWVCECGDKTCVEKLTVTLGEYHDVRSHDDWFLIKPGHEKSEVERVVGQHDGYAVVEKYRL